MADENQNKDTLKEAIEALDQITANSSAPKTIKKSITDLVTGLKSTEYSMSVRAANAISVLDDIHKIQICHLMFELHFGKQSQNWKV